MTSRSRYGNVQNEDRHPKEGDLVLTPEGDKGRVESWDPEKEIAVVNGEPYRAILLFLHTGVIK